MRWSVRSRSRLEAAVVVGTLLGVGLIVFTVPGRVSAGTSLPPITTGVVDHVTLYGGVIPPNVGWGFAANNTTNPGPHLFVSYGDTVQLTLIAVDGANHNWFIDYDNSSAPNGVEPSSPTFSSGNSIVWNFTADRVGTFVYRCKVHPTDMQGLIVISAPTHYTLYGSVLSPRIGWGLNATNINAPGPTLVIAAGTNVTLTLYSADGLPHTWFLDFDNNSAASLGEPQSAQFGGTGNRNPLNYSLTVTRTGTFVYRCGIHTTQMWGMIIIVGTGTAGTSASFPIELLPGIMLAVIIGVLFLAAVYQVRAARAARMKK